MRLKIGLSEFKESIRFYEYMHRVVSKHINHQKDGEIVSKIREKYGGKKPVRYYKGHLMQLYRILTSYNFSIGFPIIQAYNPGVRLKNDSFEMIIRLGSILGTRTFLGRTIIDNLGKDLFNEESLIPEIKFKTRLFMRGRLAYECLEDARFSPFDESIFFVNVLRGPGFPIHDMVITWMLKDEYVAPIMYNDLVLSDNRDSFSVSPKLMAIRPHYKLTCKNAIALGYVRKDEPNVVEEIFSHEFLMPNDYEEKTGSGVAVKIGEDEYMLIFHSVYKGKEGIKNKGTTGIYINYAVILDTYGNIKAILRYPLTLTEYPYSGQRPGTVFVSGATIVNSSQANKLLPNLSEFVRDYNRLLVLFAGLDDESVGVFVQDLDKILEKMEWL